VGDSSQKHTFDAYIPYHPNVESEADDAKRTRPAEEPEALRGLHGRILEQLGLAVCGQSIPTGTVMTIDDIERQYGASRSVIRETVRVLESMGLVSSRRRVGVLVLPPSEWNLYDPQVIRWRLASPARITQLRSLTELRTAVEPEAARLAAIRSPLTNASDLMGLAGQLWAAGEAGDQELFLSLDSQFHGLVLASSGNEMFAKLDGLVTEVLSGRTNFGLMPQHPHAEALQLHVDVAAAIQRGAPEVAEAAMLKIMQRTMEEMSSMWDAPHQNLDFIRPAQR
jgi:DNA-binding FadR family transcriptional regulator